MFRIATPAFLILCTLLSCGGEPQPQDDRRPVIFISIDSLRADHCTPYGYTPEFASNESTTPFMQRLANEGALFENCSAAAPWTLPSHVSMLSGMHPIEHGVRARRYRMSNDLELVSSRFQNAGYETGGFYSAPFLHGVWGFARGFDTYEPALDYLQGNDAAHAMVRRGSREIQKFHELADG
ncbi:MAG: sulfatase-like hydrolase/transferase, partial [Planctomycetes bacterium]|nr:sulfatase-like hydrolase/transferase [Planctomycetota bacterium]